MFIFVTVSNVNELLITLVILFLVGQHVAFIPCCLQKLLVNSLS